MRDIDKKIKELEKELKKLKDEATKDCTEKLVDDTAKMKGKNHKLKVIIKDETNNEIIFDDYIMGGIVSLLPVKDKDKTYTTAYTNCPARDIMHMLDGVEKISSELTSSLVKNMANDLFKGFKDLLEGDNNNE